MMAEIDNFLSQELGQLTAPVKPSPPEQKGLSAIDRDLVIRAALAEAGGSGPSGMVAVAHVVKNRLSHGKFGNSAKEIVLAPNQFEPFNHWGTGKNNDPKRFDPRSQEYRRVGELVDSVFSGELPDLTSGATHFYAPDLQAKLGRKVPNWAKGKELASIGGHLFYAPEGKPAAQAPVAIAKTIPAPQPDAEPAAQTLKDIEKSLGEYLPPLPPAEAPSAELAPLTPPQKVAPWGKVENTLDALLAGHGHRVGPALDFYSEAAKRLLSGEGFGEALQKSVPTFRRGLAEVKAGKEKFEQEYPGAAVATKLLGNTVPILAGVGATNALLGGMARVAPRLAPAAKFLTGQMGGLGSNVAAGGLQGGVGNAILGEDPKSGALFGAALGGPLGLVARGLTSPLRATARPEVAEAARNYIQRGGELPASAIVQEPGARAAIAAMGGKGTTEAVEKFYGKLGDLIGARPIMEAMGVKGLTPEVLAETQAVLSDAFDTFASQRGVVVDSTLMTQLHNLRQDIETGLRANPAAKKAGLDVIENIENIAMGNIVGQNFQLTGRDFLSLIGRGGLVDDLYRAAPAATPFGEKLKGYLFDALERTLPEAKKEIMDLRGKWKNLLKLEKVAGSDPTGMISPKRIASRFGKETGDLGEVAQMGHYLPNIDSTGATKEASGLTMSMLERLLPKGPVAAALGGGAAYALSAPITSGLGSVFSAPGVAIPSLALLAGGAAGRHMAGKYFSSPAFTQKVIENSLQGVKNSPFINPLAPFISTLSDREPSWRSPL